MQFELIQPFHCSDAILATNKKPLQMSAGALLLLAPQPGLEPGTYGLTVGKSVDGSLESLAARGLGRVFENTTKLTTKVSLVHFYEKIQ